MTGKHRHRNDITNEQHLNRHADRPYVFYFFPTAQKILKYGVFTNTIKNNSDVSKYNQRTIGTFASRTRQLTTAKQSRVPLKINMIRVNPSLQMSQFSHPQKTDNKGEKSYFNRLKIELN